MNKLNLFESQDFYLSAYLVASGVELTTSERNHGLTTFQFSDTNTTRELVEKYYSLAATINPIAYCNAIRNLKSIIHATPNLNNDNVKQFKERYHPLR